MARGIHKGKKWNVDEYERRKRERMKRIERRKSRQQKEKERKLEDDDEI
jgi:hypothetical protein